MGKSEKCWQKFPKLIEEAKNVDELHTSWCGPLHEDKDAAWLSTCS